MIPNTWVVSKNKFYAKSCLFLANVIRKTLSVKFTYSQHLRVNPKTIISISILVNS